jgi:hypothetical protein
MLLRGLVVKKKRNKPKGETPMSAIALHKNPSIRGFLFSNRTGENGLHFPAHDTKPVQPHRGEPDTRRAGP